MLEIARADVGGEHDRVTDTELGERVCGADRVQEIQACLNGVADRNELLVKLARGDLFKQLPLRRHQLPVCARRPQQRLVMFQSSDVRIIPASADTKRGHLLSSACTR